MKSNFLKLTALLLLLVMTLTACGTPANEPSDDNQTSEEPTTEADTSNDIYIERKKICGILAEGTVSPDGKLKNIILQKKFIPRFTP